MSRVSDRIFGILKLADSSKVTDRKVIIIIVINYCVLLIIVIYIKESDSSCVFNREIKFQIIQCLI